ncbi:hypothetical protein BMETH_3154_0 [methanotrophic bacterial endosymbiont of Bathymodiolus sp.]|nr:hypothetical protein BMETH_3154_0 [methanotrophic bacterial endosymbiont of Bathymodiolus sp.]
MIQRVPSHQVTSVYDLSNNIRVFNGIFSNKKENCFCTVLC